MWCEQEGVLFQFLKDESKPIIVKAERILLNVNPIYRLFHTKENLNFICSLLRKEAGRCIYSGSSEMTRRKRQLVRQVVTMQITRWLSVCQHAELILVNS